MGWLRQFPLRKFLGLICGFLVVSFSVAFLMRAICTGSDVPEGVVPIMSILLGCVGGYMGGSNAEAIFGRRDEHEGE